MRALPALLLLLGLLFAPRVAHSLSDYEKESVRIALDEMDAEVDPAPAGKIVEDIDVVVLEVIEPRDPAPRLINWFHTTTRPDVVAREVLVRPGRRYDAKLVAESERNLRVHQTSVVVIVPVRSKRPDRVRLLVVTKDVWSLRLNWDAIAVNGRLQALYLQPSEENLFGRQKMLSGYLALTQATYTTGLLVVDPRIAGTRLQTNAGVNWIWNCQSGRLEGTSGSFAFGKPLYSTRTRWAWTTSAQWQEDIVRPLGTVGLSICKGGSAAPVDLRETPAVESLPYQYRRDYVYGLIAATRSFGIKLKHNVAFGIESRRGVYRPLGLEGQPAAVQDEFRKLLPVTDTRLSPFVQLHGYENRFHRTLEVETLALQEDFRLGHDVWLRAYPASTSVGSSRTLLGVWSGVGYTLPMWDGLVRAYGSSSVELSDARGSDAELTFGARVVSPRLGFGRVVVDGLVVDRVLNYLNPLQTLGGTTRLRGYKAFAFVGPNAVVLNAEIRTAAVEIYSMQFGAVAFYDVGDAFTEFGRMKLHHGAGMGIRALLPQLDRTVFRVDLGFPLNPSHTAAETSLVVRFQQAFEVPALMPANQLQ